MSAFSWIRARFEPHRAQRFISSTLLFTSVLLSALASESLSLAVSDSGRWTPPDSLTGTAVHMALLPGYGSYNSVVMWWFGLGHHEALYGGLLGWKPGEYNCGSFPDTNSLAPITLPLPDSAGVFCSSESHLADGRLFLAGGTQPGTEYGTRHAYIFDPKSLAWTKVDSMSGYRWYPTSTTLADGRQLVTSGSEYPHIEIFGGLRGAESVPRDKGLFRYGVGANGVVDSAVYTGSGPIWPTQREGHGWVFAGGVINMFGGKDSVDFFNKYVQLARATNALGSDYDYVWNEALLTNSPPARWDHSVVASPDTFGRMIVYGGIQEEHTGAARCDRRRLAIAMGYWHESGLDLVPGEHERLGDPWPAVRP